jgi:hypothetical protein
MHRQFACASNARNGLRLPRKKVLLPLPESLFQGKLLIFPQARFIDTPCAVLPMCNVAVAICITLHSRASAAAQLLNFIMNRHKNPASLVILSTLNLNI